MNKKTIVYGIMEFYEERVEIHKIVGFVILDEQYYNEYISAIELLGFDWIDLDNKENTNKIMTNAKMLKHLIENFK